MTEVQTAHVDVATGWVRWSKATPAVRTFGSTEGGGGLIIVPSTAATLA